MFEDLDPQQYNDRIAAFREAEYPMLRSATYLDHAGTTLYSRSLIDAVSAEMLSSMVVNPHSASSASLSTTQKIDDVRVHVLQYFCADPNYFDLVFVANATGAIKLVAEAFRDHPQGFWFGYHKDAHTSIIGVRELSSHGNHCFRSDAEVEEWLEGNSSADAPSTAPLLFAYPGQSNMNGRRLPLDWPIRFKTYRTNSYTLLDAAALVSTAPLDLSDQDCAPDFTALSFYKIFGFPDLGALIVHKRAADIFRHRRYFGGGTVEVVSCLDEQWHTSKAMALHARLEDGTLPIRNIMALKCALETQQYLYGRPEQVASHTNFLARTLFNRMAALRHGNGSRVCTLYHPHLSPYSSSLRQGPIIAFNLRDSSGNYQSCYELNKLASVKDIHLRTGTLCNPAGVADALELSAQVLRESFDAGVRCGTAGDVRDGKPIAMARVSFGASSTLRDVETFVTFIEDFFVQHTSLEPHRPMSPSLSTRYFVKTVTVYPIKSCAGWSIPANQRWQVSNQGLAWDREWCLVHQGTKSPLNQKRCPAMAMMRPSLDLVANVLRISYAGQPQGQVPPTITLSLSRFDQTATRDLTDHISEEEQDPQDFQIHQDPLVTKFFSTHLGVPCFLARASNAEASWRNNLPRDKSKLRANGIRSTLNQETLRLPGSFPTPPPSPPQTQRTLANESPILTISQASLNHLNRFGAQQQDDQDADTVHNKHVAIPPESFRANIVLCTEADTAANEPFEEEGWAKIRFFREQDGEPAHRSEDGNPEAAPSAEMAVLGACRRCQMICIDQQSGKRQPGPFTTLAKFRRNHGGARFGVHCAPLLIPGHEEQLPAHIGVGDLVEGVMAA